MRSCSSTITGHGIDALWAYRDRGALDEPHAQLVDRHRTPANAQIGVTFHFKLLNRLMSGEFPVDGALFVRIDRTVDQLEVATDARHAATQKVLAALEPIEAAASASRPDGPPLSTDDRAALLAIVGGANLHEHLLTDRQSIRDRLLRHPHPLPPDAETATRRPDRPGHQPPGTRRPARLPHRRRTPTTHAPKSPARPGASPSTSVKRR